MFMDIKQKIYVIGVITAVVSAGVYFLLKNPSVKGVEDKKDDTPTIKPKPALASQTILKENKGGSPSA